MTLDGAPSEADIATAQSARYSGTAIVLHWLIGIAIVCQIAVGWYITTIARGTPLRSLVTNLHKSTGLILGVLILARLAWRLANAAPAWPLSMPSWQRRAARWNHLALYACMIIMPSSGYIASNFSRFGVKLFNSVLLPPWGPDSPAWYAVFNGVHVVTGYLLAFLVIVHILAALRHAWQRDGIMARMSFAARIGRADPNDSLPSGTT